MPIRWSALKVSEAIDMAEEFVKESAEPLEQAKIVATEARKIANLPGYLDQRLVRLICQIQRIDSVKEAIEAVRKDLPDGAIEAERNTLRHGNQTALM
jgi:hypothetical protein